MRTTASPEGATLSVENFHAMDMTIYLVRGSTPIRLGSLGTLERRTFTLPVALIGRSGTLQLMANPLGARHAFTSQIVSAAPGDRISWRLEPNLALSSLIVR